MKFRIQERKLLPDGDYDFVVEDAKPKLAKTGSDMIETKLLVSDGNGNKTVVYDRLMDWNMEAFLASIGEEVVYGEVDIEPFEFVNRSGRLRLVTGEFNDEKRNEVRKYLAAPAKPVSEEPVEKKEVT